MNYKIPFRILVLTLVLLISCEQESDNFVTSNELRELSVKIESDLNTKEAKFTISLFDATAFEENLDESFAVLPDNKKLEAGQFFEFAYQQSVKLINSDYEAVTIILIGTKLNGKDASITFLVHDKAFVDYVEFYLAKNASGDVVVSDFYSHWYGEKFSTTMSNYILNRSENGGREFTDAMSKLNLVNMNSQKGSHKEAYDIYITIPEKYKKQWNFRFTKAELSSNISDSLYIDALTDLQLHCPDPISHILYGLAIAKVSKDTLAINKSFEALEKLTGTIPEVEM